MVDVVLVVIAVVFVVAVIAEVRKQWRMPEDQRRAYVAAQQEQRRQRKIASTGRPAISQVGQHASSGGLACPQCGGSQFKARRTGKARAGIVATGLVGAAVTRQKLVQCVTCGAKYARG